MKERKKFRLEKEWQKKLGMAAAIALTLFAGMLLFYRHWRFELPLYPNVAMGEKLYDINAQPNIFPKIFYESWENPPHDFALDLYAFYMAKKKGLKVVRFAVEFPKRVHGTSKWNTGLLSKWKFIKRTVDFSVKLKRNIRNT